MKRFAWKLAVGMVLLTACGPWEGGSNDEPPPASGATEDLPPPPTPETVEALVEPDYDRPELHRLTKLTDPSDVPADRLIPWKREYDGIEMMAEVKSVLTPFRRWETRSLRELKEPEPVRRSEIISLARAAAQSGLAEAFQAKRVTGRLVYWPELVQVATKTPVTNAADVEIVISGHRLTWELSEEEMTRTYVDAYSGALVERFALRADVVMAVPTLRYGTVPLDVTPAAQDPLTNTYTFSFKDPVRTTLLGADNRPLNGQGLVGHTPTMATSALTYGLVSPKAVVINDLAFALRQTWDYYSVKFGRRGLRDLRPSTRAEANDAIIYFRPNTNVTAYGMYFMTGLIRVDQGSDWTQWATLDVIGHEWSHAVYHRDTGGSFVPYNWGSTGGMSEASADLFGQLVEAYTLAKLGRQKNEEVQDGWIIAQHKTKPIRNLCSPELTPKNDVDEIPLSQWSPGMDDPAVKTPEHVASGPFGRVFCLLARGMVPYGSPNNPELQSPLVPDGFPGLGSQQVGRLQYQNLSNLRGQPAPLTGINIRKAMIDSATMLYGQHSPEYKAVEDAFHVINIGNKANRLAPIVTLQSGTVLSQDKPILVGVTSTNPMKQVDIELGATHVATLTVGPPWTVTPPSLGEGSYVLRIKAVDTYLNSTTQDYPVVFDGTGPQVTLQGAACSISQTDCSAYRYTKPYLVTATDFSGLTSISLHSDGVLVGTATASPHTFEVTYSTNGTHEVRATAVDVHGNTTTKVLQPYIDLAPPVVTAPVTVTPDPGEEGKSTFRICATDNSPLAKAKLVIDGVLRTSTFAPSPPGVCYAVASTGIAVGSHTYSLELFDRWGNSVTTSGTFTQPPPPPCNTMTVAGTNVPSTRTFSMGKSSGTVKLTFEAFGVHDRFRVLHKNGTVLADTGCISGTGTRTLTFSGTTTLTVSVAPSCNPQTAVPTTEWWYVLSCP